MEPFLSLGFYRTFDLSGDEFAQPIENFKPFIALQERMGYASRPMWSSGATPTRYGAL